jgi:hypothetical protein
MFVAGTRPDRPCEFVAHTHPLSSSLMVSFSRPTPKARWRRSRGARRRRRRSARCRLWEPALAHLSGAPDPALVLRVALADLERLARVHDYRVGISRPTIPRRLTRRSFTGVHGRPLILEGWDAQIWLQVLLLEFLQRTILLHLAEDLVRAASFTVTLGRYHSTGRYGSVTIHEVCAETV